MFYSVVFKCSLFLLLFRLLLDGHDVIPDRSRVFYIYGLSTDVARRYNEERLASLFSQFGGVYPLFDLPTMKPVIYERVIAWIDDNSTFVIIHPPNKARDTAIEDSLKREISFMVYNAKISI